MNKSNFGQWVATAILSLPIFFLGWVMFGSSRGENGGRAITTVAFWVFIFIIALGVLYFMVMLTAKHRDKATKALKGIQNLFNSPSNEEKTTWEKWKTKSLEDKRWSLYIALAVGVIIVAYSLPEDFGSGRYRVMGAIVLIMLHLVIWPFFSDKTSLITKTLVSAFLVFCVIAFVIPNATDKKWKEIKASVIKFDDEYGKLPAEVSQPVTTVSIPSLPQTLSVEKIIPIDATVVVTTPPGHRLSSVECPPENVMEITDGYTHAIRQIDCAGEVTLKENELRNKEIVFFQKPGASSPSKIVVWWVKV